MAIEHQTAEHLIKKKKTLAVAESCTGGLLSHRITNLAGSSQYFLGGIISYSNKAKTRFLKVPQGMLKKYGAVSNPVAEKMAKGVRQLFNADYGIAISGIAGPSGGTRTKPVGLTTIAISSKKETLIVKSIFKGKRISIKSQAATKSLRLLSQLIKDE